MTNGARWAALDLFGTHWLDLEPISLDRMRHGLLAIIEGHHRGHPVGLHQYDFSRSMRPSGGQGCDIPAAMAEYSRHGGGAPQGR